MSPRLASGLWVQAYLMRLSATGIMALVQRRGDPTAGAVCIKICTMDGRAAIYSQSYDLMSDTRRWAQMAEGAEADIDARLGREADRDRDLWIVAIEDPKGRHLLDDPDLNL